MRRTVAKAPNGAVFDTERWRESIAFPDDPLALACDEIDRLRLRNKWWKNRYDAMKKSRDGWKEEAERSGRVQPRYRKCLECGARCRGKYRCQACVGGVA